MRPSLYLLVICFILLFVTGIITAAIPTPTSSYNPEDYGNWYVPPPDSDTPIPVGEPVKINCWDKDGSACIGGVDCIKGICHSPCAGVTNPFKECGCDCRVSLASDPKEPPDQEPFPWILVIGAIAGIGVIGAAAARRVKGARKPSQPDKKEEKKEKKEAVQYILQMSTDRVQVSPDTPADVRIAAWKQTGSSPPVPALDASIWLVVPGSVTELVIVPMQGSGAISPRISITKPPARSRIEVEVHARGGSQEFMAKITVEITDEEHIVFY